MAKKRFLQQVSLMISWLSLVAAIICLVVLLVNLDTASEVFRASMGATTFFFFMVALVLRTIGNTNLPDLKIDQ